MWLVIYQQNNLALKKTITHHSKNIEGDWHYAFKEMKDNGKSFKVDDSIMYVTLYTSFKLIQKFQLFLINGEYRYCLKSELLPIILVWAEMVSTEDVIINWREWCFREWA